MMNARGGQLDFVVVNLGSGYGGASGQDNPPYSEFFDLHALNIRQDRSNTGIVSVVDIVSIALVVIHNIIPLIVFICVFLSLLMELDSAGVKALDSCRFLLHFLA